MNAIEKRRMSVALIALAASVLFEKERQEKKRKRRKVWIKPRFKKRQKYGAYDALLSEFLTRYFRQRKRPISTAFLYIAL